MVERWSPKPNVVGSNPTTPAKLAEFCSAFFVPKIKNARHAGIVLYGLLSFVSQPMDERKDGVVVDGILQGKN